MTTIVLADDHTILRDGLKHLLELEPDMNVVGQAGTGREAVDLCEELKPHVLLLDLDMPGMDGFEVIRQVMGRNPGLRILVLTMFGHEDFAVQAMRSGAAGFAVKGISANELPDAIRKILRGGTYISPVIMEKSFLAINKATDAPRLNCLSERELQVFTMFAKGKSTREAAEELCISGSTARTYKKRILEKLGLKSIPDLIHFAIRHDILSKFS